jgi:uncharacterized membrane protein
MPPQQRPKPLVFEDVNAPSGPGRRSTACTTSADRVDGMLLLGTPIRNSLWREIVAERDAGTTEVLPSDEATTVRFANVPTDLARRPTAWATPGWPTSGTPVRSTCGRPV